jgi:hypothetical protein
LAKASGAQRQALRAAIEELQQKQLPNAEVALNAANAALKACEASAGAAARA